MHLRHLRLSSTPRPRPYGYAFHRKPPHTRRRAYRLFFAATCPGQASCHLPNSAIPLPDVHPRRSRFISCHPLKPSQAQNHHAMAAGSRQVPYLIPARRRPSHFTLGLSSSGRLHQRTHVQALEDPTKYPTPTVARGWVSLTPRSKRRTASRTCGSHTLERRRMIHWHATSRTCKWHSPCRPPCLRA